MVEAPGEALLRYLQAGREAVVCKLDGLSEYDVRRPLVPTGTNLLGLVKHLTSVEAYYLGDAFGRPFPIALPWWDDDAEPNADLWAGPEESRTGLVGLYRRAWAHADETVRTVGLDAVGQVPWWGPQGRGVTMGTMLVHVLAETHRHAGHADIVRELVDGAAGLRAGIPNLPDVSDEWWAAYRDRVESAAREAGG